MKERVVQELGIGMSIGSFGIISLLGPFIAIDNNSILILLLVITLMVLRCTLDKPLREVISHNKLFLILIIALTILGIILPFILCSQYPGTVIELVSKISIGIFGVSLMFTVSKFYTKEALLQLNWKVEKT